VVSKVPYLKLVPKDCRLYVRTMAVADTRGFSFGTRGIDSEDQTNTLASHLSHECPSFG
jgi:hypothetical protein